MRECYSTAGGVYVALCTSTIIYLSVRATFTRRGRRRSPCLLVSFRHWVLIESSIHVVCHVSLSPSSSYFLIEIRISERRRGGGRGGDGERENTGYSTSRGGTRLELGNTILYKEGRTSQPLPPPSPLLYVCVCIACVMRSFLWASF